MIKESNTGIRLLLVDDEPLIRDSLYEILRMEGYTVETAETGEKAVDMMEKNPVDVVVTDFRLPKMTGLQLLKETKKKFPKTEIIMITGYGSVESAVEAMKVGAYDYITKPINDNEIKIIIEKIVEKKRIIEENENLKDILAKERPSTYCGMMGGSSEMQHVYHTIESVASTNATILITGESGTGKGMVARAVHQMDRNRKDKPFIEISCGALSETLLESELFGHMKGAFTGAIKDKEGRFEYAQGGTIFLDEIDTFSLNLQVKLLRVLQDGVFERVGDNVTRKANARIIVATNQELTDLVEKGEFREDLYYRINVISIQMPPLRDRREDVPILVEHFVKLYSKGNNKKIAKCSDEVIKLFTEYSWPGNIRELENAIEGAVIMAKTDVINKWDIPNVAKFEKSGGRSNNEKLLKRVVEEPEKEHIISVLNECGWNRNRAAHALGVNRTTLYNKMKKYNISENLR